MALRRLVTDLANLRFPVFRLQSVDATELTGVVRHQGEVIVQSDRRDLQIVRTDYLACQLELAKSWPHRLAHSSSNGRQTYGARNLSSLLFSPWGRRCPRRRTAVHGQQPHKWRCHLAGRSANERRAAGFDRAAGRYRRSCQEGRSLKRQPFLERALRAALKIRHGADHFFKIPNRPTVLVEIPGRRQGLNANRDGDVRIRNPHVHAEVERALMGRMSARLPSFGRHASNLPERDASRKLPRRRPTRAISRRRA